VRALAPILLLAAGCASPDIDVRTTPTPGADFGNRKTYAWALREASGDKRLDDKFLADAVEESTDKFMADRGLRKTDGKPDFVLKHNILISRETVVEEGGSDIYGEDWYGPARGRAPDEVEVKEFQVGTLILDAIDPRTNQRLWRGWAKAQLYVNPSQAQTERRIREACRRMLAKFPD
jgi:hypothetical protein